MQEGEKQVDLGDGRAKRKFQRDENGRTAKEARMDCCIKRFHPFARVSLTHDYTVEDNDRQW